MNTEADAFDNDRLGNINKKIKNKLEKYLEKPLLVSERDTSYIHYLKILRTIFFVVRKVQFQHARGI